MAAIIFAVISISGGGRRRRSRSSGVETVREGS